MVTDDRIIRHIKKHHPEILQEVIRHLESNRIPTEKEINYLLYRASFYQRDANITFVACFVQVYDPYCLVYDTDIKNGLRDIIAHSINTWPQRVSNLIRVSKVRYSHTSCFRSRIDQIVTDLNNTIPTAVK